MASSVPLATPASSRASRLGSACWQLLAISDLPVAFLALLALPLGKLERDSSRLVLSGDVIERLSFGSCGFPDLAGPNKPYEM